MRNRLPAALLAAVLPLVAACASTAPVRPGPGPTSTASAEVLSHRYRLTDKVCSVVDFSLLGEILPRSARVDSLVEDARTAQHPYTNFLYAGGMECWEFYEIQDEKFNVRVIAAMYETGAGPLIPYNTLGYDLSFPEATLPVGVDRVGHGFAPADPTYDTPAEYAVRIADGNLYAGVSVDLPRGWEQKAQPLVVGFANHVMERLRADFTI